MTESKLRKLVVDTIAAGVGSVRGDASHRGILDTYNSHKPLPRGYAVQVGDHYCAATVSAAWIRAGVDSVAVLECSCTRMMELAKAKDIWVEDDAFVPKPGDAVIYDWQDDGKGDNKGVPDHVGIVERVTGNSMTIIEGNRPVGHVARHTLAVNGRYIRGFICPNYAKLAEPEPVKAATAWVQLPVLRKGSNGGYVKTLLAVKAYQQSRKLTADGVVGALTWSKLLS